jgi:hypothetical protein
MSPLHGSIIRSLIPCPVVLSSYVNYCLTVTDDFEAASQAPDVESISDCLCIGP